MIVKPSDFQGEITIGQVEHQNVAAAVQLFISKYEPKFLNQLIGSALAGQLEEEMTKETPGQIWVDLAGRVKLPCANYIYYWYQRDAITDSAGAGEVEAQAENATRVTVADKAARAWNEMAELNLEFLSWINKAVYPSYKANGNSDIYCAINSLGI